MSKKVFSKPEIKIVKIKSNDIISTSSYSTFDADDDYRQAPSRHSTFDDD